MLAPRGDGGYQSVTPCECLINYDEPRTRASAELTASSLDGMQSQQNTVKVWVHLHSVFWCVGVWAPH